MTRKQTRTVTVGNVKIGGNNPVSVQSMTNTDTRDVNSTVEQIKRLEDAGCEIIRVAVPDMEAAKAVGEIKKQIHIPLVADIHFDYKLALECLENGIDKIRINPGNIGAEYKVKEVVNKARERNVPIRIGVNGGSLDRDILAKFGGITPEALVYSAKTHVEILEKYDFTDIVISIKASDVNKTFDTYTLASETFDYPLHVGVTESGTLNSGIIKSSIGIGSLLLQGIGDTIRVSLTADPVNEVVAGISILKALGLRNEGAKLVSCPTCGRTEIDLVKIANEVEEKLANINKPIKVAVMGCVVNGPGEARDADIGVAGGRSEGLLFKKGEIIKKVSEDKIVEELLKEIDKM